MKRKAKHDVYKRCAQTVISALLGQTKLETTLLVYSMLAVLLLGYVSAQVYTSVVTQEIGELKVQRNSHKETMNKLTSEYISLSSRSRVTQYCESVLGMTLANDGDLERFAVDIEPGHAGSTVEFTRLPRRDDDAHPVVGIETVGGRK